MPSQSSQVYFGMICELFFRVARDLRGMRESSLSDKALWRTTSHFESNHLKQKPKNRSIIMSMEKS